MSEAVRLARLERHLQGVREAPMRREKLLEALEARSPEEAYALVAAVLHRREANAPSLPTLRRCLEDVLARGGARRGLGYTLRAALYAEAAGAEDERVMRLLRSPDSLEQLAEPGSQLPPAVAEIPLGVRRSLARGLDRDLLERLLLDGDPVVIGHLLENPRITEEHVVRIAARRPVAASTLEQVAGCQRFIDRPRVRRALARNPYCPTDVAVRMLAGLPAGDLRAIERDETLHASVRQQAADERARRDPAAG